MNDNRKIVVILCVVLIVITALLTIGTTPILSNASNVLAGIPQSLDWHWHNVLSFADTIAYKSEGVASGLSHNVGETFSAVALLIGNIIFLWVVWWIVTHLMWRPSNFILNRIDQFVSRKMMIGSRGTFSPGSLYPAFRYAAAWITLQLGFIFWLADTVHPEHYAILVGFSNLIQIGAIVGILLQVSKAIANNPQIVNRLTGYTVPERVIPFIETISNTGIKVAGLISAAVVVGFNPLFIATSVGLGALAAGLALKNPLGDIFGFAQILITGMFTVGDTISTPEVSGTVTGVSFLNTALSNESGNIVFVPNHKVINGTIENHCADEEYDEYVMIYPLHPSTTMNDINALEKEISKTLIKWEKIGFVNKDMSSSLGVDYITPDAINFVVKTSLANVANGSLFYDNRVSTLNKVILTSIESVNILLAGNEKASATIENNCYRVCRGDCLTSEPQCCGDASPERVVEIEEDKSVWQKMADMADEATDAIEDIIDGDNPK